eukprot:GFUD01038551.1.p1 GENE.GFUD01038551.1~~GFUD01038551.1.p1  ORF type:complete len:173 (-),score=15.47 GFUD01038551.1:631-1095(-)
MSDGRKPKPQSIVNANQKFDAVHEDTKDCYVCLIGNCNQCVHPCYGDGGSPGECFACILPTCPTCLRPCGFPRIANDVQTCIFANSRYTGTPIPSPQHAADFGACQQQCNSDPKRLCKFWNFDVRQTQCSMFQNNTGTEPINEFYRGPIGGNCP